MVRPSWIVFDIGEVLLRWHCSKESVSKMIGVPLIKFDPVFYKHVVAMDMGKISPEEGFIRIFKDLNVIADPLQAVSVWREGFIRMEETISLLSELSTKYSLGVCTNMWIGNVDIFRVKYSDIFKHMKFVVDSSVVHINKPDKRIFKEVEKLASVTSDRIFLIDDSISNVESAASLGWQTYHYGNVQELRKILL